MKKYLLAALVSAFGYSTGIYLILKFNLVNNPESLSLILLGILACFIVYKIFVKIRSFHRGEPQRDEFSEKIIRQAAAFSFWVSYFIWIGLKLLSVRMKISTSTLIEIGLLSMLIIFALSWLYYSNKGLKDE